MDSIPLIRLSVGDGSASRSKSAGLLDRSESPGREPSPSHLAFNKSLVTRRICFGGLVVSWIAGLGLFCAGAYFTANSTPAFYNNDRGDEGEIQIGYAIQLSNALAESLPLAINVAITALVECTGLIHSVSLRWALQHEGRLKFNSNLRLFTSTKRAGPNSWSSNAVVTTCIIFAYSSSSLLFYWDEPLVYQYGDSRGLNDPVQPTWTLISINILVLGLSLIGLTAVSTWSLLRTSVLTWSSNPLDTIAACIHIGTLQHVSGRCMLGVVNVCGLDDDTAVRPSMQQASMWNAHKQVRVIIWLTWSLVVLISAISVILVILTTNVDFVHTDYRDSTCILDWAFVTSTCSPIGIFPNSGMDVGSAIWKLIAFTAIQACITLALHCAEIIVNFYRDEGTWRSATTTRGVRLSSYNTIRAACTSWPTVILFLCKPVIHWLFGRAVSLKDGLDIWPPQLVYLGLLLVIVVGMITVLSVRRPNGQQPAAYGNLQCLANLIDYWPDPDEAMYWGHKADGMPAHAGTSSQPLPSVDMNSLYAGEDLPPNPWREFSSIKAL